MSYAAKILADSISPNGHRLTSFEITFPRIVLAEFNTHRVFSRNSASSRAIPVEKMLKRVVDDPFVPIYWGKNQKGMQAEQELTEQEQANARFSWLAAAGRAMDWARTMLDYGIHKQITNRLLEPFMWHTVIVTATEWSNYFNLRDNPKAQPEIQRVASMMNELYKASSPRSVNYDEWHTPLVPPDEAFDFAVLDDADTGVPRAALVSAGRCARVSYLTHDGKRDPEADVGLTSKLDGDGHMSPLEHPARPMTNEELTLFEQPLVAWDGRKWTHVTGQRRFFLGNFNGWVQLRKLIPGEADIHGHRRAA
jgi:thymidylate synthase ThyX